jgi:hypothetical protein
MFGGAFVGLLSKGKAESVFTILARCCRFDAQQASHFVVAGFALFIERSGIAAMSAFGTKRTSKRGPSMSAFGGKADIDRTCDYGR